MRVAEKVHQLGIGFNGWMDGWMDGWKGGRCRGGWCEEEEDGIDIRRMDEGEEDRDSFFFSS